MEKLWLLLSFLNWVASQSGDLFWLILVGGFNCWLDFPLHTAAKNNKR